MAQELHIDNLCHIAYNINMRLIIWRNNWHIFWNILQAKNRRTELTRLITWAHNKNLKGPEKLYKLRLNQEDTRLVQYKWRHPRLCTWAQLLHLISHLISPTPRYLPRGSASKYRYQDSAISK